MTKKVNLIKSNSIIFIKFFLNKLLKKNNNDKNKNEKIYEKKTNTFFTIFTYQTKWNILEGNIFFSNM